MSRSTRTVCPPCWSTRPVPDVVAIIDDAARHVLQEVLRNGAEWPIMQADLELAAGRRLPSTLEWLQQARNRVEFSNQSGHWDDVASYLKMRQVKRWWPR